MSHHVLFALSAQERWLTLLGLITAVLGLLGIIARFAWRIFRVVDSQLEAMAANTRAIVELTERVDRLEGAPSPPKRPAIRRAH